MQLSDLKELISEIYPRFMAVAPLVLAIILGTYLLNLLVGRALIVLANRTRLTEMDVLPFRQVLRWVTRFLSGILILSVLGFEIGGLWAMLSTVLGHVAIGFVAVWSILSHTSATMLILFLHPFQMGDAWSSPVSRCRGGRSISISSSRPWSTMRACFTRSPTTFSSKRPSSGGETRTSSVSPPSSIRLIRFQWICRPSPPSRRTPR